LQSLLQLLFSTLILDSPSISFTSSADMSATYLRSDQQAIGNRPIPSNQAHNVFIPSGKTMVQVSTGKKRKLPTGDASASASQSNATASEVKYEEEEVYEEEEQEVSIFVTQVDQRAQRGRVGDEVDGKWRSKRRW